MAFADPLRFAMATIHRCVDYANSPAGAPADTAASGVSERPAAGLDGLPVLGLILLGVLLAAGLVTSGISASDTAMWVVGVVLIFFFALAAKGA